MIAPVRRSPHWIILAAGVSLGLTGFANPAAFAQPAELVAINGKVFTARDDNAIVQGFAVRDGKFVATGTSEEMKRFVGANTKVIDLAGRFVTPGLADGHFHNEGGGPGIDLSLTRSLAELYAVVARASAAAKPGDVIVSNADWHEAQLKEQRLPTAQELDRAAPSVPVVLVRGGHDYILNTAALLKWNITKDTPAPTGGAIGHDQSGELDGELTDAAKNLIKLPPSGGVTLEDVLATQRRLNAVGITSVRVPGSYKGEFFQALNAILDAKKAGKLTLRYTIFLPGFGIGQPDRIREVVARSPLKPDEGDEWVRVDGIKLIVDGGFEGGHMTKPFAEPFGKGGRFFGLTIVPPSDFTNVVKAINAAGWRATTHAVGDAAIDEVLDAYEAADSERPLAGRRWAIEHLFVTRPDQLARIKKLGIAVSVQDHLYLAAPTLRRYLGMERASHITPVKTYLDQGFLVVAGTDSPVVPYNPFWAYYHFLTRETITDGVYGENERVMARDVLLRMITINQAKITGEDAIKGSIESGKLADFAVLSEDMLTVTENKIPGMKALMTYVDGKEVYRDPK